MHLRNGDHGYGVVTKSLHWLTVAAILGQFLVGYSMDFDRALDRQEDQFDAEADRLQEAVEGQGEAAEERVEAEIEQREAEIEARDDEQPAEVFSAVVTGEAFDGSFSLPELHVSLGLFIIVLAVVRVWWRRATPLPPWAQHLSDRERRLEGQLEAFLLTLLVAVPATGLLLVATGDHWLPLHITAQIALLVAIAVHVLLVLKHTLFQRNKHLSRML